MDDFEGTVILEKLAEADLVEAFFEAVDADDFGKARALMKKAGLDTESIETVLKMMNEQ